MIFSVTRSLFCFSFAFAMAYQCAHASIFDWDIPQASEAEPLGLRERPHALASKRRPLGRTVCEQSNYERLTPPQLPSLTWERHHTRHGHHDKRIDLTIVGVVINADGIGRQTTDLIQVLRKKASISFVSNCPVKRAELKILPPSIQKIIRTSGVSSPGRVLIQESTLPYPSNEIFQPNYWKTFNLPEKTESQVRFAYSMFESSRIPKNWVQALNTSFDGVIVPDPFLIEVYKKSGVTLPIFVIPLGRDFSRLLHAPLKTSKGSPFVFANFSGCYYRKNLTTLVRAFGNAFGNSPAVQLRLGWRISDPQTRDEVLSEVASRGLSNVIIEESEASPEKYFHRFLTIDCYVSLSTGEGFSIQPREAMALGIPVIVTDNTGQKTICASGLARSVSSTIKIPAKYHFSGEYGQQYQCTTSDVAEALLDVYKNYDRYLRMAPQARSWAKKYHFTKMIPLYRTLIKPKKVFLGTMDVVYKDGRVMTTSKELIEKYRKVFNNSRQ